ncbi:MULTISPECIES: serine hydrolase domain-containing protein [unclassified Streptomyces]|uniref:serine hydrolase domain-containing protein n=1 Tax=unclassified Streptomyces TaxID=2593676 RepID=UPI000A424128|nr:MULTISPECIES: serine hydrolase domain-containing protein [unclassified Streptomyces]AZM63871.1 serine hydrolase [Streptomyces sp. WAC 01438]RSM94934.1 serine hydrolase [Streptomyces sp. WAC 01420]
MTDRTLPASTPAEQGVDAQGVHAFLDGLEADPGIEPHSLMILRHGRLVASGWWAPYTARRPHLLYSLSKSFTATAAALAKAEGLIDFDAPVLSYFPEFEADITDPRSRAMLVRHVASMASGHESETVDEAFGTDPAEPVRGFLLQPPGRDPGTVFAYNQPCTYTLGAIVQRVTGESLTDYLRPRLFDPLGIGGTTWQRDRTGREIGFSGLYAATDAVARLGQLYLDDGVRQGRRLLPEGWAARASRPHIPTAGAMREEDRKDWDRGYGHQFWISRHGFRGDGAYGQFCLVLPEQDAVIAATTATERMQEYLELVWRHLLPAFRPAPLTGREEADAALRERLGSLALPSADGSPAPPQGAREWSDAVFTPEGGVCADQPKLTEARVTADAGGWTLRLTEDGDVLGARCDGPGWTVTERPVPVAVSGGWGDGGTFSADVVFLETPHRLRVLCSLTDGTFRAHWLTRPLHPWPLRKLGAPGGSARPRTERPQEGP